ncbi:Ureidoglycolate hydrolase [Hartmannibacter diazotrophicus]|uniref:Ureidoglycolate hydrolase n=1 Tax=Hartmannibacter diazotrophicus TaxID=1482074 RepID=A0A2C9DCP7_9HYPH|nr:ureidoglycolate lyase [Hartmannibacter diazotrophicus]SON58094.1 Ureidoglycolate hydrolase [Hartmannibacter diazotrophicus]
MREDNEATAAHSGSIVLAVRPIEADAFRPYGDVVRRGEPQSANDGFALKRDGQFPFASAHLPGPEAATLTVSAFAVEERPEPVLIAGVERHPHSPQAFMPLDEGKAMILVACPREDGGIDEGTLAAFVTEPGEGFVYKPGIWHSGVTGYGGPARFVAVQWTGSDADCVTRDLDRTVRITVTS